MKKRDQKKKSYLHIFLKKAMPSLIAYVVLLAVILPVFCKNQQEAYVTTNVEKMTQLVEEVLSDWVLEERLPYELGCRTSDYAKELQQHAWITDTETGEIVEQSDRKFYWMKSMSSGVLYEQGGRPSLPYCDYALLSDELGKYVEEEQEKCYLTQAGELKSTSFLKNQDKKSYLYRMHDMYMTENSFYPGTVSVEEVKVKEDIMGYVVGKDGESKVIVDTVTLVPKNPNDYQLRGCGEMGEYMMVIGDPYSIDDFPMSDKAYRSEVATKTPVIFSSMVGESSCIYTHFGGRYLDVYLELCYGTSDCEFNTLHYASRLDYWAVAGKYLCIVGVLGGLLILGIIALLAKKEYNTLCAFYRQNEYRKSLMNAMAHDLKTPLAAMSGYAENLKENVNTEKREYYAEAVLKNAGYMNDIIANNLKLAEFENMTELPREDSVDLILLCTDLLKKYESILAEKNCKCNVTGSYIIRGNREYLSIALENLISNAVKYVNADGMIEIVGEAHQFTISNTTEDKITVSANKLWEPFVKGDQSRSNQRGTGLGLAIAKSVLNLHDLKSEIIIEDTVTPMRFTIAVKK